MGRDEKGEIKMIYKEFAKKLEEAYKIENKNERKSTIRKINDDFKRALHTEYLGAQNELVADKVFEISWQEGHAFGYYEVENHYDEYSEFAEYVIKNAN